MTGKNSINSIVALFSLIEFHTFLYFFFYCYWQPSLIDRFLPKSFLLLLCAKFETDEVFS
ncbi:MAG TPA: hypothetical protein DER09_04375 [Prolixibacteraceae bacterium]|nr:hypothetical protein [Prolixibacteraceae bacterium]